MMGEIQIIEIPCGQGGLNYAKSITEYPVTDLRYCENITIEDDTWQKEGGCTKMNTTAITGGPTITGLHDFWPSTATQKNIAATSTGAIVSFDSSGIVDTLVSSLGTDRQTVFVEGYGASSTRKLFAFNGYDSPQVTSDGVSATGITTPPADWTGTSQPPGGVLHRGRMWGWLNHTLYGSVLTDHENFTGAGSCSFTVYPGEGEKIVAGFSAFGRLFLWKFPRGVYWLDDSDSDSSNWTMKRLTRSVGMMGPLGVAQTDRDVFFVSSEGLIHSLAAVQEYGDARSSAIFPEKIGGFIREKMNLERLNWAVAVFYPAKREWHLACTQSGYTYNNQRLVLDLHDLSNPRYTYSPRDECEAMALTRDTDGLDRPMVGDRDGFVRRLDDSTRNKDGSGYTAKFETADIELFPKGTRRGNMQYLEIVFRPQGDHDITLDLYYDGEYSQSVDVNMGSTTGSALGSFTLGTSTLGGGNVLNTRKRITGDPSRVRIIGYNSGTDENFSIASILLGYTAGNQRVNA